MHNKNSHVFPGISKKTIFTRSLQINQNLTVHATYTLRSQERYINLIPFLMQWHSYTYLSNEVIRINVQGAGICVVKGKPALSTSYEPGIKKSSRKCI